MQRVWRYALILCVLVCAFFFISFNGQAIYAAQANTNANQVQTTHGSTNTQVSTINWNVVADYIKLVGGSLLGIITALTSIYKLVLEKNYDIKDIEIELINKKLPQNTKYTDFICERISMHDRVIELLDIPNPYYLDMSIKITTPNGRKTLNDIVIRKLVFYMNGYVLICKPRNKAVFGSPKCPFNKQEGEETCDLLLKWPTIKEKDDRVALNPTMTFRNPVCLSVYLAWFPSIILASIGGYIFPQKREIVFEKIKHENGSPRIRIKSKGIFKGNGENGYKNL